MTEGYRPWKKFRLDPRTKLFLIIVVATLQMVKVNIYFSVAVAFIPFLLFISNRQYLGSVKYMVVYLIAAFIHVHRVQIQLNMVLNLVVVLLGGLVLQLGPAFACADYILKSTSASETISALGKLKIGRKITIPVSVMFRFFPTINQERKAIHDAAAMRGILITRLKFWKNPFQAIEYRLVPWMIAISNSGEDLSAASLSRGLDNPVKHTTYTNVKFTKRDLFAVLFTVIFLVSVYFITT